MSKGNKINLERQLRKRRKGIKTKRIDDISDQKSIELGHIEDMFLEYLEQKDQRICPECKRPVAEWGDDWLPTTFEACGKCWDAYRRKSYK